MKKNWIGVVSTCIIAFLNLSVVQAQQMITSSDQTINFVGFNGSGFAPNPATGQLDSDSWSVTGTSDGNLEFGESATTGDFARGTYTPGRTTGGIYGDETSLWIQPIGTDFTPGSLTLKMQNSTGSDMSSLIFTYKWKAFNNEDRSNSVTSSFSTDGSTFLALETVTNSEEVSDDMEDEYMTIENIDMALMSSVTIPNGGFIYFRLLLDDNSGGGSRDEFGFESIRVKSTLKPLIPTMGQWALLILGLLMTSIGVVFIYNHRSEIA